MKLPELSWLPLKWRKNSLKCSACEGFTSALTQGVVERELDSLNGWRYLAEPLLIQKTYKFKTFSKALNFLNVISIEIERQNHHPKLILDYNKLKVQLTTHAVLGVTENDLIMARIIDKFYNSKSRKRRSTCH
jgi:4a-hydroxytetrahydrobiopterin dehydratase